VPKRAAATWSPLAQLSPLQRKRVQQGGVALACLVALFVIFSLVGGSGDKTSSDGEEESLVMDPDLLNDRVTIDPEVLAARLSAQFDAIEEEIEEGRGASQVNLLKKLQSVWPQNVRVNHLLGRAYIEKRYWADGFKYLRKAIALDEELRSDPLVIKAGIRALSSQSKPGLGQRFLVQVIGKAAIPYLEETVNGGSKRQKKYAARALKQLQSDE